MEPQDTKFDLNVIEARARRYADAREKIAAIVTDLNAGMEALKREAMPGLKRAIASAVEHHDQLKAMIEASPELFVRPRTVTFHGVRLGYMKGKGGVAWDDPERVVLLIERHFPEQLDILCKTTRKPAKEAIANLDVAALKKIGCRVVASGDQVFIKPVDGAVDKMVDALLKAATEEAEV